MKHLYKLSFLTFLLPIAATAQSNYKPGYVVNSKGDTLKGFIDYKEWSKNPKQFSFKNNFGDARSEEFNLENASAFAITGFEYYERHTVSVSTDSMDVNTLHGNVQNNFVTETVFLRIVSRGSHVSLYSYTDAIKRRFYLSQVHSADEAEELAYHAYNDPEQSNTVQYVNRYRIQLQYSAQSNGVNSSSLQGAISRARYDEDDLSGIVSTINGGSVNQFTAQKTIGTRWFAGAAASYGSLKYSGVFLLSDAPASSSVVPLVDAGIDVFPFKGVQKLYFRAELGAMYRQYNFAHRQAYSTPTGATTTLNVKQFTVAFTPQVIYNIYNKQQFKNIYRYRGCDKCVFLQSLPADNNI